MGSRRFRSAGWGLAACSVPCGHHLVGPHQDLLPTSQCTQRGLSSERMSKVPRATQLEAGQLGYVLFLLKNSIFIFRFRVRMRLQIYF